VKKPLDLANKKHPPLTTSRHQVEGVHLIAFFEALKGLVVLAAGFGLLHFIHRDLQAAAEELVRHSHLNPARHYPRVFIEAAGHTSDARLWFFAGMAFLYATVRLIEAWGLWYLKTWAEWFAIISGSIYLPIEIFEIAKHITVLRVAVFLTNALIVVYLAHVRWASHQRRVHSQAGFNE
jgi:uncharacterized membrane protein (DUF2068 family)